MNPIYRPQAQAAKYYFVKIVLSMDKTIFTFIFNIKIIFVFSLFVYFNHACIIDVFQTNPHIAPQPHLHLRSENKLVMVNDSEIFQIIKILVMILIPAIFSLCRKSRKFNPRFISINTCTNLLQKQLFNQSDYRNFFLFFSILSYIMLFDLCLLVLLPSEMFEFKWVTRRSLDIAFAITRHSQSCPFELFSCAMKSLSYLYEILTRSQNLYEKLALWYLLLHLIISSDIHPNPGPFHDINNFNGGFFSFCNWNLNTLSKDAFSRVSLLEAHNTNFNYDIISLCETSLNDTIQIPDNILPGYKYFTCNHPDGNRSGGVGIFYKETLPLRLRQDLSFEECIVSELIFGHKRIFFTVIYRNPENKAHSPEFDYFLENFTNLFHKIKNENPYAMFFTGDFNGHSQAWYPDGDSNPEGLLIDDIFTELNLTQLISEPTHFFRDDCKPSCIDLIITDQPNIVLNSGVRPSIDPTVKHQIIFCKINFKIPPLPKFHRKIWHFNRARTDLIMRAIALYPWEVKLGRHSNPTHQVNMLNECVLNIMSNFVPNELKTISPREPEWLNRNVKNLLRKQNKIYKRFKKNGYKNEDKLILDRLKNECFEAISKAKEKYYKELGNKLADPATGQKIYWKIMNKFLNKCKIPRIPPLFVQANYILDLKEKATVFNNYFTSQCTPLVNDSELPNLTFHTNSRLSTFEITSDEINNIIVGLCANKAHGSDNISVNMLKLCGPYLCLPLKIIFTNIIETGIFPAQWKEANVTPVHKKNDKQLVKNYRPISLLPILAKVFERIIFKNLYNYLISNNLITKNQSGFRPGDSVTNQLLSIVHDIHTAFDDKNCLEVRSIYLDMSKAFDKVWHDGLIFKLKQNGIEGKLLTLLRNYLTDRKQRVVINGKESSWGDIMSGVPQGSVLGPLLFLVYINDLEDGIKSIVKFFADDTSIFSIVRDPSKSAEDLNHDLSIISKWAHQWKMSFNPDQSKQAEEIIFSQKRKNVFHPPLYFNNFEVKRVDDHKHLGLILDSKLSFTKHINEKIETARKGIGIIKHLAPYVPLKSRDQIYKMYVRPHLDYCDIIFHIPEIQSDFDSSLTLNYQMNALERTQYQAALAVSGTWKGTNRDKIYEELGWETLHHRRFFRRLIQFYKIMNNITPEYLKCSIPPQQGHLFGHRSTNIIYPLCGRTSKYQNSFFPDSIKSWNNIGPELRGAVSLSVFKKNILKIIRPEKMSIFNIEKLDGIRWIFQLRVGLSPLKNHKKLHNFQDTNDDTCQCTLHAETTCHFLLKCPNFNSHRQELFHIVDRILIANNIYPINDSKLVHILLYGHKDLKFHENKTILNAVVYFVGKTSRF